MSFEFVIMDVYWKHLLVAEITNYTGNPYKLKKKKEKRKECGPRLRLVPY